MAVMMRTSQKTAVRPAATRTLMMVRPAALRPVRATPEDKPADVPPSSPISNPATQQAAAQEEYKEYKEGVAQGQIQEPKLAGGVPTQGFPSFTEVMGFSGAPELINGRLAMLGFTTAVAAELVSGQTVYDQVADEPTLIIITFLLFIAASLVPAFLRQKREPYGPFTPHAELINGRAAMIGFAALIGLEAIFKAPLF